MHLTEVDIDLLIAGPRGSPERNGVLQQSG